jgi:hypothetical protein
LEKAKVDYNGRLTLKWPNVDNTLTRNNKEIFVGTLKLRGSRPFQMAFIERSILYIIL